MPDGEADFDDFEARIEPDTLLVDIDGFEGPLDLLLQLARNQKVDLRRISVLALAEQYLQFIQRAKTLRIELATDYLIMAAWLTYLKSRLLLPRDADDQGRSGEELAAHLAFQLERLAAMRDCAGTLMGRDRLGRDFFVRGMPEDVTRVRHVNGTATLMDLLEGYVRICERNSDKPRPLTFVRERAMTPEQALERLRALVKNAGEWTDLTSFLPDDRETDPKWRRSVTASHFAASLELAKGGTIRIRQGETFAPVQIKAVQSA
ncbi:MAG: segregation/condensation protein A [Boseongicola sp. SB0677_bin_26]|nr:segregation/condensation protein A [Boseongicola sp. SB0665_bin_10]MYG25019.1 segregation/condensation protein A [Boseongicola sp. SB0677_bin_26]